MIQKELNAPSFEESYSEYEMANLVERIDAFLEDLLYLDFLIERDGAFHLMSGFSKDLKLLNKESLLRLYPICGKSTRMMFPDAGFLWLKSDYDAFIDTEEEFRDITKKVLVNGKGTDYNIRFSKLFITGGDYIGVIVSIMAQSEIDRSAIDRCELSILKETIRQIRACCHDFSQPLMVISGYSELMEFTLPEDGRGQFEGFQEQIEKISRIFKTLRGAVLSYRQQMDLIEKNLPFNSLNVS